MEWRKVLWLGFGVALLWLLAAAVAVIQLESESRRISTELATMQAARRALLAARQAMDSAQSMVTALDQADAVRGHVASRLATILQALPDSVFLTAITLDSGESGILVGRARELSRVSRALETTPGTGTIQLEGLTVRDSAVGLEWERFSFRLGQRRAP